MERNYYLFDGKKKTGPFILKDLHNQVITGKHLIWYEGLDDWRNVNDVEEIKNL